MMFPFPGGYLYAKHEKKLCGRFFFGGFVDSDLTQSGSLPRITLYINHH